MKGGPERESRLSTSWSTAFFTLVALGVGIVVAYVTYGVCNENIDPETFTSAVCRAFAGDGNRLAIAFAPAVLTLTVGVVSRSRRLVRLVFALLLVVEAVIFALLMAAV